MDGTTVPSGFTRISTLPDSGLMTCDVPTPLAGGGRGNRDRSWVVAQVVRSMTTFEGSASSRLPELGAGRRVIV